MAKPKPCRTNDPEQNRNITCSLCGTPISFNKKEVFLGNWGCNYVCKQCAIRVWIPAEQRPLMEEDFVAFWHSIEVLFTDGKSVYCGYLQVWEDDDCPDVWKMKGRDGYTVDGVTGWMHAPPLPDAMLEIHGEPK